MRNEDWLRCMDFYPFHVELIKGQGARLRLILWGYMPIT
jgi:hypothetical protein